MKIEILFLGKTREKFLSDGINEYKKRLSHYTNISIKVLKNKGGQHGNDTLIKEREGKLLLSNVVKSSLVVALDSAGKQVSSEEIRGLIDRWEMQGIRVVTFLIGGPVGLSEEVIKKANMVLSMSRLTFTHDTARMLLLEQLYRGYTIKRGEKYHK